MPGPNTIDEYLAPLNGPTRAVLESVRRTIAAAAPEATESINYEMPGFRYRGTWLVGFGAFKHHCSFFPGTIKFTAADPIAPELVSAIVKERMAGIDAKRPK